MRQATIPAPVLSVAFDLGEALAGAPLVTRKGCGVRNFKPDPRRQSGGDYPFQFEIEGIECSVFHCTPNGTYWLTRPDAMDLFIAEVASGD